MEDLSLHILDIVENSIRARASKINIKIVENIKKVGFDVKIIAKKKLFYEELILVEMKKSV